MIIKRLISTHYSKNQFVFLTNLRSFLLDNFKIMVVIMTITIDGLKMHLYMKLIQVKRIIKLWINTSHVMFHYYQLCYKMYNNINTLKKKKKFKCCLYVYSSTIRYFP